MRKTKPSLEVQRWTILKHMLDDLGGALDYDAEHVDAIRKKFKIQGSELMLLLLNLEQDELVMRDKENTLFVLTEEGLKTLNPDYQPPRLNS